MAETITTQTLLEQLKEEREALMRRRLAAYLCAKVRDEV